MLSTKRAFWVLAYLITSPTLCISDSLPPLLRQPCPFGCKEAGVAREYCREWQSGDECFVEDRRPRDADGLAAPRLPKDEVLGTVRDVTKIAPEGERKSPASAIGDILRKGGALEGRAIDPRKDRLGIRMRTPLSPRIECDRARRDEIPEPVVRIDQVRSIGGPLSDRYEYTGVVSGACILEANFYERGLKRESISTVFSRSSSSYQFRIRGRSSDEPEIRIRNSRGYEARFRLEDRGTKPDPGPRTEHNSWDQTSPSNRSSSGYRRYPANPYHPEQAQDYKPSDW